MCNLHYVCTSVVQRKEILRQLILPLYPERSLDRSKDGNVVQKIINNSCIPPTGDTLCANYLLFWGGILLLNNAVCLSYLFIKFVNHILDMASYNRDKFIPPVTIVSKYVMEKISVWLSKTFTENYWQITKCLCQRCDLGACQNYDEIHAASWKTKRLQRKTSFE